jgi:hypothetical protein
MHFWRKSFFETLKQVEAEALTRPEWADYALFCREYEKGLRPQAHSTAPANRGRSKTISSGLP